jgi:hypothetical protein
MMIIEYIADYGLYVTISYYTRDAYHLAMKHKDKLEIRTGKEPSDGYALNFAISCTHACRFLHSFTHIIFPYGRPVENN